MAHPEFTFHLKQSVQADLPARTEPITDEDERRAILAAIQATLEGEPDLEAWVENSPLVEVHLIRSE